MTISLEHIRRSAMSVKLFTIALLLLYSSLLLAALVTPEESDVVKGAIFSANPHSYDEVMVSFGSGSKCDSD